MDEPENQNSEEKPSVVEIETQEIADESPLGIIKDESIEQTLDEESKEQVREEKEIIITPEHDSNHKIVNWFSKSIIALIIVTIIPTAYFYYERVREATGNKESEVIQNILSVYSEDSITENPNDVFSLEIVDNANCFQDDKTLIKDSKYVLIVKCEDKLGESINFKVTSINCPGQLSRGKGKLGGKSEFNISCN